MVVVTLAGAGTTLIASWLRVPGLDELERVAYDARARAFSPKLESDELVILAIDDLTFQGIRSTDDYATRYGNWPYSRYLWTDLVTYLADQGARALVVDAVMDEQQTDEGAECNFSQALHARRLPFYLGFAANPQGRSAEQLPPVQAVNPPFAHADATPEPPAPSGDPFDSPPPCPPPVSDEDYARALAFPVTFHDLTAPRLEVLVRDPKTHAPVKRPSYPVKPIPAVVADAAGLGLVDAEQDPDGTLRRTRFAYSDGINTYATLPVAVAADLVGARHLDLSPGTLQLGERSYAIDRDGSAEIDYGGTLEDRFTYRSLLNVLDDATERRNGRPGILPDHFFRGKVVLVGGFAVGTYDAKATPFSSNAPGVVKQAAVLDSFLHGRFITRWSPLASGLLVFGAAALSALLVVIAFRRWVLAQLAWLIGAAALAFVVTGLILGHAKLHVPLATPTLSLELAGVLGIAFNFLFASEERERMRKMFSRYVSQLVVDQLATQPELPRLDGENREVTAFFSDIRKFSTFSEKFKDDPKQLVRILNTYLTRVSAVLLKHGACLDKYIGDAVVCIFGAPLAQEDHAVRSCRAALEVQAEIAKLRAEFKENGLPDVYTRIGINSAVMFVGNFGSEQLFNYTAMGDGMNLASRLEGANKAYETLIMIGPRTRELAGKSIEVRELDWARVAGKTEAVAVYELLAMRDGVSPGKRQIVDRYHEALGLYRQGKFTEAIRPLESALGVDPNDGPTRVLLERCRKFVEHPPKMPFDGIVNLDK